MASSKLKISENKQQTKFDKIDYSVFKKSDKEKEQLANLKKQYKESKKQKI